MTPSRRSGSPALALELLALFIGFSPVAFGQVADAVKVQGKTNPFYVDGADVVNTAERGVVLTGNLRNSGGIPLLRITILIRAKSAAGKQITATATIASLPARESERFAVALPSVASADQVESATYHVVSFSTEEQARRADAIIRNARITFCQRMRQTLGNKPIGSLTTNESDTIASCKLDGLW